MHKLKCKFFRNKKACAVQQNLNVNYINKFIYKFTVMPHLKG